MPKFFDNGENGPAKLTGLSTGSWSEDIDLTADASYVGSAPTIPSDATGVILRFVNPSGTTEYAIGCRKPGSTRNVIDDLYNAIDGAMTDAYCGCVTRTIDVYIENTQIAVYVIGYFEAETDFFADGACHTFNAASTSTWHSVDLSSYLSSGCVFAILDVGRTGGVGYSYNFRHPDSTDNRTTDSSQTHQWLIVPVDSSRNVELWTESTFTDFRLIGEITSNATSRISGGDVSISTTGSYATVDFSSLSPPSGAVLAVVEAFVSSGSSFRKIAIRRYNDTSYTDLYEDIIAISTQFYLMPLIDADDSENERCQAKIEGTTLDFYVWGWIENAAASGDIEVDINDPISLSESISSSSQPGGISVVDSISLAEQVNVTTAITLLEISVSSAVTISEVSIAELSSFISVVDTITLNEDIGCAVTSPNTSVYDTISVSEQVALTVVSGISVSVVNSVGITESVEVVLGDLTLSTYDTITVTEVVSLSVASASDITITSFDTISLAEDVAIQNSLSGVSVYDTVSVSEYITLQNILGGISVYEETSITDVPSVICELGGVSVYDTISVSESVSISVTIASEYFISVYDTIAVTEDTAFFYSTYNISVVDTILVTEAVSFLVAFITGMLSIHVQTDCMSIQSGTECLEIFAEVA